MDRYSVWPDFYEECVVYHDDALIVVNKPVGIPAQAVDPDLPDDLPTRLRAHLVSKGLDSYLGVHQRLDRDTSGVVLMTRRRDVNAAIAAQFEGRNVRKVYLACVEGWPEGRPSVTLRDTLASDHDGRMRVVPAGRKGDLAILHAKCVERGGARALLQLELETGRTHQARVQLAHMGCPIAGDTLYGGPLAPRLMLHAHSIGLLHPQTKKHVLYEGLPPPDFKLWLEKGDLGEAIYDDLEALDRVLSRALEKRFSLGRSAGPRETTAFRLINEGGDALPFLAVDVYDAHLVAQLYGEEGVWKDQGRRDRLLDRLAGLGFDGVYLKVRPKQANLLVDTRREDLAPPEPVRGSPALDPVVILEEKIPFHARLGDGLSTGIFLDQRANRRRVVDFARDKRVLNLFAYTCAFSVAAARGGATCIVSVDVSAAALERGRENLALSVPLDSKAHVFVADDVFAWLARAARRGEKYDLVLLDPPSYSSTKARRFSAENDYGDLATAALAVVAPGGRLLACTNHRKITRAKFRRVLHEAVRSARRDLQQLKDLTVSHDFPPPPGSEPHSKSALITLR